MRFFQFSRDLARLWVPSPWVSLGFFLGFPGGRLGTVRHLRNDKGVAQLMEDGGDLDAWRSRELV